MNRQYSPTPKHSKLKATYYSAAKWVLYSIIAWAEMTFRYLPCPYAEECSICEICGRCRDHGAPCVRYGSQANEYVREEHLADDGAA